MINVVFRDFERDKNIASVDIEDGELFLFSNYSLSKWYVIDNIAFTGSSMVISIKKKEV